MRPPKNVCPACGVRCEQERVLSDIAGENPLFKPRRCSNCGDVHEFCSIKHLTPAEREESRRRKAEYYKEWYAENSEQVKLRKKLWYRSSGQDVKCRIRQKKRYREDPEFREYNLRKSREWEKAHPDRKRELKRMSYERHAGEICFRKKLRRLRKLEEAKRCR